MKDVKLYMTQDEYDGLRKGEYAFGYAFSSLLQAHKGFKEYYGDITIMQKYRRSDVHFYKNNGDVDIYIIKQMKASKHADEAFTDLWVNTRYMIEGSEYCRSIRETDFVPAFASALCEKCIEKKCKFFSICVELYEMNKREREEGGQVDGSRENKTI